VGFRASEAVDDTWVDDGSGGFGWSGSSLPSSAKGFTETTKEQLLEKINGFAD
jgi:hypothetical protein